MQDLNWGAFDHASHASQLRSCNYNIHIHVHVHCAHNGSSTTWTLLYWAHSVPMDISLCVCFSHPFPANHITNNPPSESTKEESNKDNLQLLCKNQYNYGACPQRIEHLTTSQILFQNWKRKWYIKNLNVTSRWACFTYPLVHPTCI